MSCQSDTFVVSCMRSTHFCCTLLMHHFGDANIAFYDLSKIQTF